jgi:predicted transcriptional regulator of viral defense system
VRAVDAVRAHGGAARWRHLAMAGITRGEVARAMAAGLLVRVGRGTYALPGIHSDHVEATRLNGYLSHVSAAEAWGLDLISPPPVPRIALPHNRPAPHTKAVLHRIRSHELAETTHIPWPVTTIERTLVDCARTMPFADTLAVADSALRRGLVDKHVLTRLAQDVRGRGLQRCDGHSSQLTAKAHRSVSR